MAKDLLLSSVRGITVDLCRELPGRSHKYDLETVVAVIGLFGLAVSWVKVVGAAKQVLGHILGLLVRTHLKSA